MPSRPPTALLPLKTCCELPVRKSPAFSAGTCDPPKKLLTVCSPLSKTRLPALKSRLSAPLKALGPNIAVSQANSLVSRLLSKAASMAARLLRKPISAVPIPC
jgi:hypothetical protein